MAPCATTTTVAPDVPVEPPAEPPAPAPLNIAVPESLEHILLTIRLLESSDNYTIAKNKGGASGAYQYIDSTWGNYRGYPSAYLAPPWVQDERAILHVQAILDAWDQDVSMVPVIWYYPKAATNPELMDQVPMPWAGNRLTIREYQTRWLDVLESVSGESFNRVEDLPADPRFLSGRPPEVTNTGDELTQIAYPVLGDSIVTPPMPCPSLECEPGTDAVIFGHQLQPILVAADGVVTSVTNDLINGTSVTITDLDGRTYRYSGFNDDNPGTDDGDAHPSLQLTVNAQVGATVKAGQVLGFMGNTDPMPGTEHRGSDSESVIVPHLRLRIRDADGRRLDADALVAAARSDQACNVAIGPWSMAGDDRIGEFFPELEPVEVDWIGDQVLLTSRQSPSRLDQNTGIDLTPFIPDADLEVVELPNELTAENLADEAVGEPSDDPRANDVDPQLIIHADGTVTARGSAALTPAPGGCIWSPELHHGPAAAGDEAPDEWFAEIELPAELWVNGGDELARLNVGRRN